MLLTVLSCNNSNSNDNDINLIIENEMRLKSLVKFELVKESSTYDVQHLRERVSGAVLCFKQKRRCFIKNEMVGQKFHKY